MIGYITNVLAGRHRGNVQSHLKGKKEEKSVEELGSSESERLRLWKTRHNKQEEKKRSEGKIRRRKVGMRETLGT